MIRFFFIAIAVVATALLVGGGLMGGVAAQESTPDAGNLSEDELEEISEVIESESEADTLSNQQEIKLSSSLSIVGWEFTDGTIRLGVDSERPNSVTIADGAAGVGESGATRVPKTSQRVFGGVSVVVMPVEEFAGGHVVTVSSDGESIRLSTDMDTGGDDPLNNFGGHSGLFSGIMMTLLMSVGGAGFVLWREETGAHKA